jgi:hypothetical protein
MQYFSLRNLSHDDELAIALGNMVIVWAYAELSLLGALARITGMGLNMTQSGYYRIPTFEARVKFIRALVPGWTAPDKMDKAEVDDEIDKLARLSSARNHWVHGDWCCNRDESEVVIFDHRAAPDSAQRRKPVKAADVKNHIEAVLKRADKLRSLIDWHSLKL